MRGVPFDAEGFRSGILTAMGVGMPEDATLRPTFHFPETVTNTAHADADFVPFDPASQPTRTRPPTVQVACAYEYQDVNGVPVNFGVVTPARVELTLLDAEYQLVKGFDYVVIGGGRYNYRRTPPPVGMVTETVWTIICEAEDED